MAEPETARMGAADAIVRRPMLATLVVASALSPLAINIFIPSMASIAADLGTDGATAGLGLSLYLVAVTLIQLLSGPLSDRYGRRPVILGGLVLFLVGTALCLFAQSIGTFLVGRVVQAASAAGISLSRAVVRDVYSRQRSAAMIGYVTMGLAIAPMVGPAIGGVMDTAFGWRSVFWLLVVLGALALALAAFDLNETNPALGSPMRSQVSTYRALFSESSFWVYAGAGSFATASFFGFLGGATFVAIDMLSLTPAEYGFWFILCPLGYALGNFLTGRYSERFGIRRMMLTGSSLLVAATISVFLPIAAGLLSVPTLFGPMFVLGVGCGLTIPTATAGGVSVRPDAAGAAAGLLGASQIGLGAIASSVSAFVATGSAAGLGLASVMLICGTSSLACSLLAVRVGPDP